MKVLIRDGIAICASADGFGTMTMGDDMHIVEADVTVDIVDCMYSVETGTFSDKSVGTAQAKMVKELEWYDLMLKYVNSGDTRRSQGLTTAQLHAYAIACRDYVAHVGTTLTIVEPEPTRPVAIEE